MYRGLFEAHPWAAHFLVHVVKRVLMIVVKWIDDEVKPSLEK